MFKKFLLAFIALAILFLAIQDSYSNNFACGVGLYKNIETTNVSVFCISDTIIPSPVSYALNPSLKADTIRPIILKDSVVDPPSVDTLDVEEKEYLDADIDYPVFYKSSDSINHDFKNKRVFLYGSSSVLYGQANIEAEYIDLNISENVVYAFGETDSLGLAFGKPVLKDGEESSKADTIRYNLKTKVGLIKNVITEYDGSYLHGGFTKVKSNRHVHMRNGKFTTCDHEHPHYYFSISKVKVIPDDKIVWGPAYLVVADIPTPLGIPFGFFPNTKGGASGLIIPEFGQEHNRGFFLRKGGYYWALSDYMDLILTGDVYTKGSWGVGVHSNYKLLYKFNGFIDFEYNQNVTGYAKINLEKAKLFSFKWKFIQDSKAIPNMTFSADVNMSSSSFDKFYSYNVNNYMQTNKQSSISFSKLFPNTPFNLTAAIRYNQNNSTKKIDMNLPDVSFSMNRIYPLKRSVKLGKTRFYEKVGLSYSMNLTNKIRVNEKDFANPDKYDMTNGINHRIPINTSMKFLKYTTVSPSFNYSERWYFKSMQKSWILDDITNPSGPGHLDTTYTSGFNRVWDYNLGLSWSTQVYGTFNFKKSNLKAIRHALSPSVSFNYLPNFAKEKYNYYSDYSRVLYNSNTGQYDTVSSFYSRFEGMPYGVPTRGGAGSINFNLGNNLEIKLRNSNDTLSSDRKVKIFESLNFSTSYNIIADSLNWSPINISGRTSVKILDLSFNASLDPYAIATDPYNPKREMRINASSLKHNSKLVRLTSANISASFSLNSNARAESVAKKLKDDRDAYQVIYGYQNVYADFDVPWNLRVNYSFVYSKPYSETNISQTINISGELNLTKNWKIMVNSGYDIKNRRATPTTIDVFRDLHCWEASLHVVPFGFHKSYFFKINVKASILQDLKLSRNRNWFDNFNSEGSSGMYAY